MTPLLGTKNPSAPVGDKSGGGRRAARSLLSCVLWRGMGGMARPEPLSAHHPHQQQGLSGFSRNTRHETRITAFGYRSPSVFFSVGGRYRLKVMTPLLGTKNPSATVGDKSGGDRRAARAAAFQVFTKHETRDPRHGYCQARGVSQREFPGFHETRNTRHESRLFPDTKFETGPLGTEALQSFFSAPGRLA